MDKYIDFNSQNALPLINLFAIELAVSVANSITF